MIPVAEGSTDLLPIYLSSDVTSSPVVSNTSFTLINKESMKCKSNLNLFFWNVQGISNKIDYLSLLSSNYDLDVITVAEHWIKNADSAYVMIPGFVNASFYCRPNRLHGGAAIFIKENIEFKELTYIKDLSVEMTCEITAIELVKDRLTILSIYRPYNNDISFFNNFMTCLYNVLCCVFKNSHNIILCADFNVQFNTGHSFEIELTNLLYCFGLTLTISDITRPGLFGVGSCIDNVVTDIHQSRWQSKVVHTILSDHNGILFSTRFLEGSKRNVIVNKILVRVVNDINVHHFMQLLCSVSWFEVYSLKETNDKFKKFLDLFLWAVNGAFPLVKLRNKSGSKADNRWYNDELRLIKEQCDNLYSLCKSLGTDSLRERYRDTKRLYKATLKQTKVAYYSKIIDNAQNKNKTLWKITNSLSSNNNCKEASTSNKITPNSFNDFFIDNVNLVSKNVPNSKTSSSSYLKNVPRPTVGFYFKEVSVENVYKKIIGLSNSTCLDIYGLNSYILKISANVVCEVLTYLFNECLINNCIFPILLKSIKVIPVFKKGDKNAENNYRPISIVPIVSKLFESLLHDQLSCHLETLNIFTDKQFGFRPKRSTSNAVMRLVDNVVNNLENGSNVAFRSFDMSKAFDTVKHNVLTNKLEFYRFSPDSVKLIESYLSLRTQFVFKEGSSSKGRHVEYGVPQGSILGPILFNLYINDLPVNIDNIHSDGTLFADDFGLKISCKNKTELCNNMAISTTLVEDWCAANNLSLNSNKICDLFFSFNRSITNDTAHNPLKFLGLWLDPNLNWHTHVDYISNRLAKGIYMLRRLRESINIDVLLKVYYAQIQSLISYGILLWGYSSYCKKLFILQKKAIRIICSAPFLASCRPLFIQLRVLTLPSLFVFFAISYVYDHKQEFKINSDVHQHDTRNKNKLRLQSYHFSSSQKNWRFITTRLFNSVPYAIKVLPSKSFKEMLKNVLVSECIYNVDDFYCIDWKLYMR